MLRAIVFDLDNTLLLIRPSVVKRLVELGTAREDAPFLPRGGAGAAETMPDSADP